MAYWVTQYFEHSALIRRNQNKKNFGVRTRHNINIFNWTQTNTHMTGNKNKFDQDIYLIHTRWDIFHTFNKGMQNLIDMANEELN